MDEMTLYNKCLEFANGHQLAEYAADSVEMLPISDHVNSTLPEVVSSDPGKRGWRGLDIFYISDIHLTHKVTQHFKDGATNSQVLYFVKGIVRGLFTGEFRAHAARSGYTSVIFGGDISSSFEISKIFFTEFVEEWDRIREAEEIRRHEEESWRREVNGLSPLPPYTGYVPPKRRHIFVVLGNHELWDFSSLEDCAKAYRHLFKSLGIRFLQNDIEWFTYPPSSSIEKRVRVKDKSGRGTHVDYIKYNVEEDYEGWYRQLAHEDSVLVVGGVGFAGCNTEFNADCGLYCNALTRGQEILETKKWQEAYLEALELAHQYRFELIVLTHNPIKDWFPGQGVCRYTESGCVYFNGHTHRNSLHCNKNEDSYVFANNQVGYRKLNMQFKTVQLWERPNPFVDFKDGYHEIDTFDYIKFYSHIADRIEGTGPIDRMLAVPGSKFYMVKRHGYYAFFVVVNPRGTYLCNGGSIKKISKCTDIHYYYDNFSIMINLYLKALTPYRKAQEEIAKVVQDIGGRGKIHGCIVDVSPTSHIMVNPLNGVLTYYYSPMFGVEKEYGSLLELLINHNDELVGPYQKKLCTGNEPRWNDLFPANQACNFGKMMKIDIKNSLYPISGKMQQLQRLFSGKILRSWDEDLLLQSKTDDKDIGSPHNELPGEKSKQKRLP